jgi:hypothetical protein
VTGGEAPENIHFLICAKLMQMMEKAPGWFTAIDAEPYLYSAYSNDPETSKAFQQFKQDKL